MRIFAYRTQLHRAGLLERLELEVRLQLGQRLLLLCLAVFCVVVLALCILTFQNFWLQVRLQRGLRLLLLCVALFCVVIYLNISASQVCIIKRCAVFAHKCDVQGS